jgi:hypothetical protein
MVIVSSNRWINANHSSPHDCGVDGRAYILLGGSEESQKSPAMESRIP